MFYAVNRQSDCRVCAEQQKRILVKKQMKKEKERQEKEKQEKLEKFLKDKRIEGQQQMNTNVSGTSTTGKKVLIVKRQADQIKAIPKQVQKPV
ncbi:MAG: hypothetical protein EZS28_002240, partial [Streblomastix strix]